MSTCGRINCAVCGGKNSHYANCPLAGDGEVYAVSAIALNIPKDVIYAAVDLVESSMAIGERNIPRIVALAILAERKRCADVARTARDRVLAFH